MTESLYCRECGTKISAESRYCRSCGAKQSVLDQSEEEAEVQGGVDDAAPPGTVSTSRQDALNEGAGKKNGLKRIWTGLAMAGVLGLCLFSLAWLSGTFTEESTEEHPSVTFSNQRGLDTAFDIQWQKKVSISSVDYTTDFNGGVLYVGSDQSSLVALGRIDGNKKWKHDSRNPITTSPVERDGSIYVGTSQGITVLSKTTGKRKWRARIGETASIQPLIKGGVAYLATNSGSLYALDVESGEKEWHVDVGDESVGSLAFGRNMFKSEPDIVVAAEGKTITALDGNTGKWQWAQKIESGSATALATNGHTVYAGVSGASLTASGSGDLYSFDARNGDKNWKYSKQSCSEPPIGCDIKNLYYSHDELRVQFEQEVSSIEHDVLKNSRPERKKWSYSKTNTFQGGVETIFLNSRKKAIIPSAEAIHSFNTVNGDNEWSIYFDNSGGVKPLVGNGLLYAVTSDKIYAVSGAL